MEGSDAQWARIAGTAFVEGAASESWGIHGLRTWFQEHLVDAGHMAPPISVHEAPIGTVTLYPRGAGPEGPQARLPTLLASARATVLGALRGFLAVPTDDRFVTAALFSGRVRRATVGGRRSGAACWVPRPEPAGSLSAVVLSVFAIDVLTHRERYERELCVCDVCGRVAFQEGALRRRSCSEHSTRASGFLDQVKIT